jgi:hypothetical protein
MEDFHLPCKALEWSLAGHWRRGSPQQIWNENVAKLMREQCMSEEGVENCEKLDMRNT